MKKAKACLFILILLTLTGLAGLASAVDLVGGHVYVEVGSRERLEGGNTNGTTQWSSQASGYVSLSPTDDYSGRQGTSVWVTANKMWNGDPILVECTWIDETGKLRRCEWYIHTTQGSGGGGGGSSGTTGEYVAMDATAPEDQALASHSPYYQSGTTTTFLSTSLEPPSSVSASVAYALDPDDPDHQVGTVTLSWSDDAQFFTGITSSDDVKRYSINQFLPDTKTWKKIRFMIAGNNRSLTFDDAFKPGRYYFTVGIGHELNNPYYNYHSYYTRAVVVDVTDYVPVSIKTQPVSKTAANGSSYSFSVSAEGVGLTYAWYRKLSSESSFSILSGKTASVCSGTASSDQNGAQFYCVVRDQYGSNATSDTVTLTTYNKAAITAQPQNKTVNSGNAYSFSISATGKSLTYAWYTKRSGDTGFTKAGSTGTTLSGTASGTDNGMQVYCIVTDSYGNTARSNTVTLTVNAVPVRITVQPKSSIVSSSGSTGSTNVTAEGEGLTYQWYEKLPSASSFTKSTQTTRQYSIVMKPENTGIMLYCIVKDANGNSVTSNTVTLAIGNSLKITTQPSSVIVPSAGSKASTSVTAEGEGLTYEWYVKLPDSSYYAQTYVIDSTFSVLMTQARNGMQVYCLITDQYGRSVQSNTVTFSVGTLGITSQPKSKRVLKMSDTFYFSVKAEGEDLTYQWYRKNQGESSFSAVNNATSSTYTIYSFSMGGSVIQAYCIVTDKNGNTVKSNTASAFLSSQVTITEQPVSVRIAAEGKKASVSVTAVGDGLKYQWFRKRPSASSFSSVSSATTNTYTEESLTSTNSGTQVYCVVTDSDGNTATSNTVTLTLTAPAKIVTQPESVKVDNLGDTATFSVKASGDGLAYSWYIKLPTSSSFSKVSEQSSSYSSGATVNRIGMQVYCIVTDLHGYIAQSSTVTLSCVLPRFGTASFILPSGVTGIEAYAFDGDASIKTVEIKSKCKSIGQYAFRNCTNLRKIRIPANCTIGNNAFEGCTAVFIYSKAGSPAETYCKSHSNCLFVEE